MPDSVTMQRKYCYVMLLRSNTWQCRSKVEVLYQGHLGNRHSFSSSSPRKAVVAWGVDVFHAMAFSSLGKVSRQQITA